MKRLLALSILLTVTPHFVQAQLTTTGSQIFDEADFGNDLGAGDRFGGRFAVGDFNSDGLDDVAIASVSETIGVTNGAGAVTIALGTVAGITTSASVYYHQGVPNIPSGVDPDDQFGWALAACDFNGDTFDDLAVGVPGEEDLTDSDSDVGAVHVLYSVVAGGGGLDDFFFQPDIGGFASESGDRFGETLACGDFDNDGFDDLVIGSPFENWIADTNAGFVDVIYGSVDGLNPDDTTFFRQGLTDLGTLEAFDYFGSSLAVGDFDDDGYDDLVVGSVGENGFNGAAFIISGGSGGLDNTGAELLGSVQSCGLSPTSDRFADSLAVGDFNGDTIDDLAIGVSDREIDAEEGAGMVCFLQGDVTGPYIPIGTLPIWNGSPWEGTAEADASLGFALASGDFDGDGYDDLAVSAPFANSFFGVNTGIVWVYHGAPETFMATSGHYNFIQLDLGGSMEAEDRFGYSLAAGDFNGDSKGDLLIGVPDENSEAGWVHELFGEVGEVPFFADGFESGDTSGWSSSSP